MTPCPYRFFFICTVLMSSDSMGNKIHIIQQQHPSVPLSSCSQPLDQFVILDDSRGRGTALSVMDGPGGDYTPGECKAPTLPCNKSPPTITSSNLSSPLYQALFRFEMKLILYVLVALEKIDSRGY